MVSGICEAIDCALTPFLQIPPFAATQAFITAYEKLKKRAISQIQYGPGEADDHVLEPKVLEAEVCLSFCYA